MAIIHFQIGREYTMSASLATIDQEKGLEHLRLAQATLEEAGATEELGLLYCRLSSAYWNLLLLPQCISWSRKALEMGE